MYNIVSTRYKVREKF